MTRAGCPRTPIREDVVKTLLQFMVCLLTAGLLYLAGLMAWVEVQRRGDRYFGRTLAERRRFVERLKWHARYVRPIFEAIARVKRLKHVPVMRYGRVTGPVMMSSKRSYARTVHYRPEAADIFIATQMKCGTTWMQQIVFEILHGGEGDLSDTGYRHMYAVSPWIETSPTSSVPMERAPLVGPRRNRIIKTHMPAQLIPHSNAAKYIYVTRHPVSCFASCVDFIYKGMGPLTPTRDDMLDWFCSDDMWWMSWPDHVESWWQRSQQHDNVLFVHYEDLKRDLAGGIRQVAAFLDMPLTDAQLAKIVHKADFAYMSEHEEAFEMFAPNLFSVSTPENIRYMQSGALDRHKDAGQTERERILAFCRARLAHASYPVGRFYPDIVSPPTILSGAASA